MKTIKTTIILIITLCFLTSCSTDDDTASPTISAPSVTYSSTNVNATFFQEGNSTVPTVNWNGNQGAFSLASTINGLSINSTTGVLNWTKELAPDTYNLQVIATNSAGQTSINITIHNPLQGTFTGVYDDISFFEIQFNPDGSLELRANDETNPTLATGTWTLNSTNILIDYTYDAGGDYSLSGTLTQSATTATYAGDWFYNHGAVAASQGGDFTMSMD